MLPMIVEEWVWLEDIGGLLTRIHNSSLYRVRAAPSSRQIGSPAGTASSTCRDSIEAHQIHPYWNKQSYSSIACLISQRKL